jgi:hypothetical protein
MRSKPSRAPILLASLFILTACTSGGGAGSGDTTSPTTGTGDGGEAIVVGDVAPLTGMDFGDINLNRPALSAKVDNHPSARPQVALDRADIVFEELVEGGLTRYVAVWHSDLPPEIGPVRSVRPMDPDIVSPFGGILAYSGGQQRFIEAMLDTPVVSAIHGQSDVDAFFYRSNDKVAPHNVIVRANELVQNFGDVSPPRQQFSYATGFEDATAVLSGQPVSAFSSRFSSFQSPGWGWSADDEAFLRSQTNGAPDVALSGDRIAADNVVSLFVEIQVIQDIPTTFLVSSGEGFVATGGHQIAIEWSKASARDPIVLRDLQGNEVLLAPGNTWVELLPGRGSDVPAGEVIVN